MSAVLRDHQHEITDLTGGDGIVFGTVDTGWLTITRPTITPGEVRSNDAPRPQEDGVAFGRDYRGNKTFVFEMMGMTDELNGLGVDDPHRAILDELDRLGSMWDDEKWRDNPASHAMLRTCEAGRTTRCYGRPRDWTETASVLTQHGYAGVVANFVLIDDRWYSDEEHVTEVGLVPPSEGGLMAPLVAPLTTTADSTSEGVAVVAGVRSTWPVIEFHGPVAKPQLKVGGLIVGLTKALTAGQVVTIDPRPWQRTVTLTPDNAGVAGWLNADTPVMRKMLLRPGTHDLVYTGQDITGTSYVRLRWRDARSRP